MYTLSESDYIEFQLCIHCRQVFTLSVNYVHIAEILSYECIRCTHSWKVFTFFVTYVHIAAGMFD